MLDLAFPGALPDIPSGGALDLDLADVPLDELLFSLHTQRFTGAVRIVDGPHSDRISFREGVVVGLTPPAEHDVAPFAALLTQMKMLSSEAIGALYEAGPPRDGVELTRRLLDSGLLGPDAVHRAAEEHARRRLFSLFDLAAAPV